MAKKNLKDGNTVKSKTSEKKNTIKSKIDKKNGAVKDKSSKESVIKDSVQNEEIEVLEIWEPHADEIMDAKDRHIKRSKQSTNRLVLVFAIVSALLIFCYSFFTQRLAFNTRQQTTDDSAWNIGFTNMEINGIIGGAKELGKPSFTNNKANFYISLSGPGDKIIYDLVVRNNGTLTAKVDSIYIIPENKPDDSIIYSVGGINLGDELKPGQSIHMTVTAMYNRAASSSSAVRKDMSVIINYKQI